MERPETVRAARNALGPGTGTTSTPSSIAARTSLSAGSAIPGFPASEATAIDSPFFNIFRNSGIRLCSLWEWNEIVGRPEPIFFRSDPVLRVSSAAIQSTVDRISTARSEMSPMFPIGVPTRYNLPASTKPRFLSVCRLLSKNLLNDQYRLIDL